MKTYYIPVFTLLHFLVSCLLGSSTNAAPLQSVPPSDTVLANGYYEKAEQLSNSAQYDSARTWLEKAIPIYEATGHWEGYVRCYNKLGDNLRKQGNSSAAMDTLNRALEIGLERLSEAHPRMADGYNNIGIVYYIKGDFDKALEYFQKALDIRLNAFGKIHADVASSYNNIASIYWNKGDYDHAIPYLKEALNIKIVRLDPPDIHMVTFYYNLGYAYYSQGSHDQALDHLLKALNIIDINNELDPSHHNRGLIYNHLGNTYASLENYEQAMDYHKKALDIFISQQNPPYLKIAKIYNNMGNNYRNTGAYDQGLYNLKKALDINLKLLGPSHPEVAANYMNIADLYINQKMEFDQGLDYLQKAIMVLVRDFEAEDIKQNPLLANITDEYLLLLALKEKAAVFEVRYAKSGDLDDLRLSASTYVLATRLIERIKSDYKAEKTQLSFSGKTEWIYGRAIRSHLALYQETREDTLLHQLFSFAEKSKAWILREALNESQAKHFSGIPESLLDRERELKIAITKREFEGEAFDLNRQYDSLIATFEKDFPEYYRLKYDTRVATVGDTQRNLAPGHSSLIEYFVGDTTIYAFYITREDFKVHALDKPDDLEELVRDLRKGLSYSLMQDSVYQSYELYTHAAHKLYKLLLEGILKDSETINARLIIIPDGPLGFIPFESLLYEEAPSTASVIANSSRPDYHQLSYLLKRHQLSYHYSGTLIMGNAKKTKNKAQQQVLAFAPGYGEGTAATRGSLRSLRNNDLGDLPGARREVRAIADYADGDFYIERGAKELSFKQKAENYRIIHLAMHGTADHENPLNSRLIFHTPTDSLEDGTLYAYEIYGLDLNTDMVVLSACETGTGQYANGEGVMSLGRAFMYAGASSVVQTSWEIPDKKSAQLMNSFYQSLSEGMDKASALQQAKLDYLSSSTKSDCHPFFWASFAAYGDVTPIKLEKQNSRWYWLLLIPVVLLGVWLLYRKFWRG